MPCTSAKRNIRDSFSESDTADQCEDKANNLEEAKDTIESAAEDLETFDEAKDNDDDLTEADWVDQVVENIEQHLDDLEPER